MPSALPLKIATVAAVVAAAILLPLAAGAEPGFSSVQSMPNILGTSTKKAATYGAVSCPTSTSCTAVGPGFFFTASSQPVGRATAVTETAGAWGAPTALPLPAFAAAATPPTVNGVVCSDATDCQAVGSYVTTGGMTQPLVETETAGAWSATSFAPPSGAATNGVATSLACTSAGNCTALGYYEGSGFSTNVMVDVETAGTWGSATQLGGPVGPSLLLPISIACTAVGDCTAVGVNATGALSTDVWTESAGTWSGLTALPAKKGTQFLGLSVACPASGTCLVAGELGVGDTSLPAVQSSTAGTWSAPTRLALPRLSPASNQGGLDGITCPSATQCETVGSFGTIGTAKHPGTVVAGAATWTSGTWSSIGLVRGVRLGTSLASVSSLITLSCASTTSCVAVGEDATSTKANAPTGSFSTTLTPTRAVTAPAPPASVLATPALHGLVVSWSAPVDDGGSPVTGYAVTASPGGAHCQTVATRCRLTGLADGHGYRVTVRDTTAFGTSGPRVSALVAAGAAPSPPHALHVVVSGGTATVSWRPSTTPPGERVTGYSASVALGHALVRCVTTGDACRLAGLPRGAHVVVVTATDASGTSPGARARFDVT